MGTFRKIGNLMALRREAWLSRPELLRAQSLRLQRMVEYAVRHVPYYREKYKGLRLDKYPVRTKKDLERLPLVGKREIQERPQDFLSPGVDLSRCLEMRTSGSTGRPLRIYYGEREDDFSKVNNLRSFLEIGYRWGDTFVSISDPDYNKRLYFSQRALAVQKGLNLFYPVEINMRKSPGEMLQDILKVGKCDILYGYPTNIFLLAKEMERTKEHGLRPRLVVTNGELLETPVRDYIRKIFQTDPFDFYTTEEFKRIAWECERHDGYHLDTGSVVVEFVAEGRQVPEGQRGEIVITSLFHRTMPLIRYRQGDVGIESADVCPCGRGLPLMHSLEGRTDNFIINRSGELFSPQIFWSIFRHYRSMETYQVRQDNPGKIRVLYKESAQTHSLSQDLTQIRQKIAQTLGDDMDISFESSGELEEGKRKSVFSSLNLSLC